MSFEPTYAGGTPAWDIGRPQDEVVGAAREGLVRGRVIDVGCGTGENALFLAGLGHDVVGIDAAPTAVERAREKARRRGVAAEFLVWDALDLTRLRRSFETALDCGLFHVFSATERARYARSVRSVLVPGGTLLVLCFSHRQPPGPWPTGVTEEEIRVAFAEGWTVAEVREGRFRTSFEAHVRQGGAIAWFARISRTR